VPDAGQRLVTSTGKPAAAVDRLGWIKPWSRPAKAVIFIVGSCRADADRHVPWVVYRVGWV